MNDAFTTWAVGRGGFFTRAEAKDYGYSDSEIQAATRDDQWVRLRHGYYAPRDYIAQLDPVARHRVQARAVHHRLGPDYTLVSVSACAAHGVELLEDDLSTVHVARIDGRPGRKEAGVRYHNLTMQPADDVVPVGDVLAMRADHALWHAACDMGTESSLVAFNSALHHDIVDEAALEEIAPAFGRWQGSRTARLAYRLADPRIETVGESRTFFLCWEHHLPHPDAQFEIRDGSGRVVARSDFAWELYRHLCEFDGRVKYVRYARASESTSDVVLREKLREDLVRAQRWGMSRLIWIDLIGTARRLRTANSLRQAMEQSRRLYAANRTVLV